MTKTTHSILLLAAIQDEIAPTLKRIAIEVDTGRVIPHVTGMGRTNVLAGLDEAIETHRPRHVLHAGVAGGLRPGLGGAASVHRVIGPDGDAITLGPTDGCILLTRDTAATTIDDKRNLFELYDADMIDMETYHVANRLAKHGIPLTAVRAVCDTAEESILPEALDWVDDRGHPNPTAAMRHLARHPWHLPVLLRMARRMRHATNALPPIVERELQRI